MRAMRAARPASAHLSLGSRHRSDVSSTSAVRLSFVIPLFNCLGHTRAMLCSLLATVASDEVHEIILVDDGSTDGTREWLGTLHAPPFKTLLNPENLGYAASNNRGIAEATGDVLALLNNDLILTPGWLDPMVRALSHPGNVAIVGNVQRNARTGELDHTGIFINAKGKPEHDRAPPPGWGPVRPVTAATAACWLVRRDVWSRLGGFDEGFSNGCEDVDLCLRASTQRYSTVVALGSVIHHHVSASPGRKRRDEANTQRLTVRWQDELCLHGARAWSEDYVQRTLNAATAFRSPLSAWRLFSHALGLRREAPPEALSGMKHAIDRELRRWDSLLGP